MTLDIYQIDAFTENIFGGNPACVVPLKEWLADEILLKIAQENAVAETAFFVDKGSKFHLRWFTPEIEMDLCGHATLATAHCLTTFHGYSKAKIIFATASGELNVTVDNGLYNLDFPSRMPVPSTLPEQIALSLNIAPLEIFKSRDYVLVYKNESDIRNISIDRQSFDKININPGGVIVTAKGDQGDFVSRFFTPQASILEDPVTGSAHCSLIPFWSQRLGKTNMTAHQLSARMGKLYCKNNGDRVVISGHAKTYLQGKITLE